MGKSPTIKDLAATDQEFTKFMEDLGKSVKQAAAGYMTEFENSVKAFYEDSGGDYIQMAAKEHEDYQVEAEFTMANIATVIQKIGKEVFETPSADPETQAALSALDVYSSMAIKIAVNFLSNALSALAWKESASFTHDIQHVSVGPGLTLHLMIVNRAYEGRGPIRSKKVLQNFIIYRLNFSKKKAAAQADIVYLQTQLNTMTGDSETYKTIHNAWITLLTSKDYLQESPDGNLHLLANNYLAIMDELRASQRAAYEAVQELANRQQAANAQVLRAVFAQCGPKAELVSAQQNIAGLKQLLAQVPNAVLMDYLVQRDAD